MPFFPALLLLMKDVLFVLVGSEPVILLVVQCCVLYFFLFSFACLISGHNLVIFPILPHARGIVFGPLLRFLLADFRNRFRVVCIVVFPSHL